MLDGEISPLEITEASSKLPYHKAPGEDDFPTKFYKWAGEEVAESLYSAFKEAEQLGSLGYISNKTVIVLLPKPGKDPFYAEATGPSPYLMGMLRSSPVSWRPISTR